MPDRRHQSSAWGPVAIAIVGSLVLHVLLWPLGDQLIEWGVPTRSARQVDTIELEFESLERDEDAQTPPEELVKLDALERKRRPPDAKRVSEFDNDATRETVAPNGRPQSARESSTAPPDSSTPQRPQNPSQQRSPAPGAAPLPLGGREHARPLAGATGESEAATGSRVLAPSLRPQAAPAPPAWKRSFEHAPDVDRGDQTLLDTQRWKYASFFNRLRDAIAEHWDPLPLLEARDPERRLTGSRTRTTQVIIVLDAQGALIRVQLTRRSGVEFLDGEAIRAIRTAAPFPNPPPGMLAEDGKLYAPFGFIVVNGEQNWIRRFSR